MTIQDKLYLEVKKLAPDYGIKFLGMFGSQVRGEARGDSDLDLLVEFSKKMSLLDLVRLEEKLTEKLGRKVDLHTPKSISRYMMPGVKRDLVRIYG